MAWRNNFPKNSKRPYEKRAKIKIRESIWNGKCFSRVRTIKKSYEKLEKIYYSKY